jgi:drug/metabolite transporter (DMT)-like permease
VAVILWGTSFVALKSALTAFEPLAIVAGRMLLASALMLPVWSHLPAPTRRPGDRRRLAVMVAFYPCLYFACEIHAVSLTTASQAGAVSAVAPLFVAVGAWLFLAETLSRPAVVGIVMAVGGVVALSLGGPAAADAPNPALGNLLELGAMAAYAASTIVLKGLSGRYSSWLLTGIQCGAGALVFLPALLLAPVESWSGASPVAWASLLYLGRAVTLVPIGLYNLAVSRMPAARAAIAINLVPIVAIVTGWALLGDTFTPVQLIACAVILAGVALGQRPVAAATDAEADIDADGSLARATDRA